MTRIRIALDWTPNTLHAGLYFALSENLYSSEDLEVVLVPPSSTYETTPAKLLENGQVELVICPSESCIAYAESSKPDLKLQAIYAICQHDASAIVTVRDDLDRPAKLGQGEGATYGSYNARYEDDIVRAMMGYDGGDAGKMKIQASEGKLSLFDKVKRGDAGVDATWVFMPWEGVEAQMEGRRKLHAFKPDDYGVPYGYSPVIAMNAAKGHSLQDDVLTRFVKATRAGYGQVADSRVRNKVLTALSTHCDPHRSDAFLQTSIEVLSPYFGKDTKAFGHMDPSKWEKWVGWLKERDLIKDNTLKVEDLYTNRFFTES